VHNFHLVRPTGGEIEASCALAEFPVIFFSPIGAVITAEPQFLERRVLCIFGYGKKTLTLT
jgi:hypothetical protein